MSYQPKRKTFTLHFEDYEGLEIIVKPTSMGKLAAVSAMQIDPNANPNEEQEVFKVFLDCLVAWNLTHPELEDIADEPVNGELVCRRCGIAADAEMPINYASLMCLDLDFLVAIVFGWMGAISRVAAPKGMNLSDGAKNTLEESVAKRLGQLQNPPILPKLN